MTGENERWSQEKTDEVARLFDELGGLEPDSDRRGEIREALVELHLPLLRYLARRFSGRTESFEDLVQVGSIGLIKAIDRFDPTLGHHFATYASPTIVGEMKRHLRDTGWLVRVPRRAQELHASVMRVRDELSQRDGQVPTVSEIASQIDASPEEVAETLDVARAQVGIPLDPLTADDDPTPQGHLAEEDLGYERVESRALVAEALACLTVQERRVVTLRFSGGHTQSEIAGIIGVSQMQISRILTRSVAKMQAALAEESSPHQ